MLIQSPIKTVCISAVRDILTKIDNRKWYQKLMNNGNTENGNKLRTYRQYKNVLRQNITLNVTWTGATCLYLPNFEVAIETGRYNRPETPVSERLCKYGHIGLNEDETHFLVDCEFYSDIRFNLFQSAQIINDIFKNYESLDLIWLMNCNDLQLQLAKVLFKMNKRRFLAT